MAFPRERIDKAPLVPPSFSTYVSLQSYRCSCLSGSVMVCWVISSPSPWPFLATWSHLALVVKALPVDWVSTSVPKKSLPLHLLHTVTVPAILLSVEVYFRLWFWCWNNGDAGNSAAAEWAAADAASSCFFTATCISGWMEVGKENIGSEPSEETTNECSMLTLEE